MLKAHILHIRTVSIEVYTVHGYTTLAGNQPPTPTQPPILSGMGHEYQSQPVMLCGWEVKTDMTHSSCGLNKHVTGKTV